MIWAISWFYCFCIIWHIITKLLSYIEKLIKFCFVFSPSRVWVSYRESAAVIKNGDRRGETVCCAWISFTSICHNSATSLQNKFEKDAPCANSIGQWHAQFGSVATQLPSGGWSEIDSTASTLPRLDAARFLYGYIWNIQYLCLFYQ